MSYPPFVTADNVQHWENLREAQKVLETLIAVEKMSPVPDVDTDAGRRQQEYAIMLLEALARVQAAKKAMKKGQL